MMTTMLIMITTMIMTMMMMMMMMKYKYFVMMPFLFPEFRRLLGAYKYQHKAHL